jgi:hypothetical protein
MLTCMILLSCSCSISNYSLTHYDTKARISPSFIKKTNLLVIDCLPTFPVWCTDNCEIYLPFLVSLTFKRLCFFFLFFPSFSSNTVHYGSQIVVFLPSKGMENNKTIQGIEVTGIKGMTAMRWPRTRDFSQWLEDIKNRGEEQGIN